MDEFNRAQSFFWGILNQPWTYEESAADYFLNADQAIVAFNKAKELSDEFENQAENEKDWNLLDEAELFNEVGNLRSLICAFHVNNISLRDK